MTDPGSPNLPQNLNASTARSDSEQLPLAEQGGEQPQQQQGEKESPENPSPLIHCLCSDGEVVDVPAAHLRQSRLFDGMCQNLQVVLDDSTDVEEREEFDRNFPVPEIRSPIMRRVADWCENHMGGSLPTLLPTTPTTEHPRNSGLPEPVVETTEFFERRRFVYTDYEREFFTSTSSYQMIELLNAANYLDIPSLFLYGCQRAAEMMEGKTCEEVRNEWNLPDDLSDEEKAQIQADMEALIRA